MGQCSVLIVSYSAVCRTGLSQLVANTASLKIHAAISSYDQAERILDLLTPDLVLVEIDIYPQQALNFISRMAKSHRNIVAMYSEHTPHDEVLQSLVSLGVREFLQFPETGLKDYIEANWQALQQRLGDLAENVVVRKKSIRLPKHLIVLGASMGGTQATETLLMQLPTNLYGLVIVQHMKSFMVPEYARRLNEICALHIKLAEDGDKVEPGHVYIAPGESHTLIRKKSNAYYIELREGETIGNHKPAVDVLFKSTADAAGSDALGIILTGMGEDGALGITQMFKQGAITIAQDEASSMVFGMPRAAIMFGGIDKILPLQEMPAVITQYASYD